MAKQQAPSDIEMISNVGNWPRWPYLPMKRRRPDGRMPECGVLVVVGENPLAFKFAKDANLWHLSTEQIQTAVEVDPQQLLNEGWEID